VRWRQALRIWRQALRILSWHGVEVRWIRPPQTLSGSTLDWVHKTANALAAPPWSAHLGARAAPAETWCTEDKRHARAAA
jgi:hypothetical protein